MFPANLAQALQSAIQHHQAGRLPEAEALYREILARNPGCADALHYLGVIAHQMGRHDVAATLIGQAAALAPGEATIHGNHGEVLRHLHRLDEAIDCFQRALALEPGSAPVHNNLGNTLQAQGRSEAAAACYQRALALKPDYAEAHSNLGNIYHERNRFAEAGECYRRALALKPDSAEIHDNLGRALRELGNLDDALACHRRALALKPDLANAHNNQGGLLKERGQLDEAIASYRRALALQPHRADIHSNLIFALNYRSDDEPGSIGPDLRRWNQLHADPLAGLRPDHDNDRSPDRQLRLGYVSPDLRLHSVAFFLLPLWEAHDRSQFHVTGYSTSAHSDDVTARLKAHTDNWRLLVGFSDEAAARQVREDGIDLLIDLSGHTAGNRLPVFARKPAPIQISYLGYPGATGLETIACRVTDRWADPPGAMAGIDSEHLVRLPETAWCFTPLSGCPPVGELPGRVHGHVTFGCFNHFPKITDDMLHLWIRILDRVPGARLAIKNLALGTPSVVQRLHAFFAARGIAPDRLELIESKRAPLDHLRCYNDVDLALDTFPYHGTTTTCEALWMGVPVVTLAGSRHAARVGVSLLANVGLPEFVTLSPENYVETAVAAARDLPRLAALRASLRERMRQSPLMDAPRFARSLEAAYRTVWRQWCQRAQT